MIISADLLQKFYDSPLGKKVVQECNKSLEKFAKPNKTDRVMGFGYTDPFLEKYAQNSDYCQAYIPEALIQKQNEKTQKYTKQENKPENVLWAKNVQQALKTQSILLEERKFPAKDDMFDCIFAVHALEFSPNTQAMLRELWRVLAPNGRLILIVPNRRGVWAHAETTPFGHGQPYSYGQLAEALRRNSFSFKKIYENVHYLPNKNFKLSIISKSYDKLAKYFAPYFGGVLIVEATKQLYNPLIEDCKRKKTLEFAKLLPQTKGLKPQNYNNSTNSTK